MLGLLFAVGIAGCALDSAGAFVYTIPTHTSFRAPRHSQGSPSRARIRDGTRVRQPQSYSSVWLEELSNSGTLIMAERCHEQQEQPRSTPRSVAAMFTRLLFLAGLPLLIVRPWAAMAAEPSPQQVESVRRAFRAFAAKDLSQAEKLFEKAVKDWEDLQRPRDELASLLKARGEVKCDLKKFSEAIQDYNRVLGMMSADGAGPDGLARYYEYPDAFVQRGLAYEGLGQWQDAVNDYTRAIELWGGGRSADINPFVLTFRGNSLEKLDRYNDALDDYQAAADIFLTAKDNANANSARANQALALYEIGQTDDAVKMMRDVLRRSPGFADMHVALAAHAWGEGDLGTAENEWRFTCESTTVGCKKYRDLDWVSRIRRWPPSLVQRLQDFLEQGNLGRYATKINVRLLPQSTDLDWSR